MNEISPWSSLLSLHNQKHEKEFLPFPSNFTVLYFLFQNLKVLLILISSTSISTYESFIFLICEEGRAPGDTLIMSSAGQGPCLSLCL